MIPRLGDLLVGHGLLTPEQRDRVLIAQQERARPFGLLAEQMFDVKPGDVERAWADQLVSIPERIDPAIILPDPDCLRLVDRRQAWQFGVLPLGRRGPDIRICTCPTMLLKAVRFTGWRLDGGCLLELADPDRLALALQQHYPMAGLDETTLISRQARA
jgi:hypothetical protein